MDLSPEKREEAFLDLFIHPGWKLLIQEMEQARQALVETAYLVDSAESLYRRKGEIQKLAELINFESVIRLQILERVEEE